MGPNSSQQSETVAWVREVNSRWIVHHGLKEHATAFIAHLEDNDTSRLIAACDRAVRMIHACQADEDPKPWFYSGLFSVATAEEAERYLAEHWFTAQCIAPYLPGPCRLGTKEASVGPETEAKIDRIRQTLAELS